MVDRKGMGTSVSVVKMWRGLREAQMNQESCEYLHACQISNQRNKTTMGKSKGHNSIAKSVL
jgi:hypothetical protein